MNIIEFSIEGTVQTITVHSENSLPDTHGIQLPYEKLFPIGSSIFFMTDKEGQDMSQALRNAVSEYKKMIEDIEWTLSLRFARVSDDTILVTNDKRVATKAKNGDDTDGQQ